MEARSKITETVIRTIEVSEFMIFSSVRIALATSKLVLKITPITDDIKFLLLLILLPHTASQ